MLNIELIRRDPEIVRQGLLKRGEETHVLDQVSELDSKCRQLITERDGMRARHNEASREIGNLIRETEDGKAGSDMVMKLREEMGGTSERISLLEREIRGVEEGLHGLLLNIPNLPHPDVPVGAGEEGNRVVRTHGELVSLPFTPLPHWELGERLGIIDFQRGAKLAGSRFFLLRGAGARLERALISWMLDIHTEEHRYTEVYPPFMVKGESALGSGHLPKFSDTMYRDIEEDLWLLPTAEVALTNLHAEEILEPGSLPLNYVAYTPCFRREKAAAGKDTRGIKRVHQFDKVELYKLVEPERSYEELEKLVGDAEDICRRLGVPYRVVQICTGDLGFASAKSYDLEMWAAGSKEWLEVSSCSNCTDFQARRANIRYRTAKGAKASYVHTLNGSGLALPRVMIALLENNQQADGSVRIPEELQPYTGFDSIRQGS